MQYLNRATKRQMVKWLASFEDYQATICLNGDNCVESRMDFLRIKESELHSIRDFIRLCLSSFANEDGRTRTDDVIFIMSKGILFDSNDWGIALAYRREGRNISNSILTYSRPVYSDLSL